MPERAKLVGERCGHRRVIEEQHGFARVAPIVLAQQLDDVERSPDQWLARVQANRQALFARQIPRTPMQMRNDGLVQQVYYSTRVQQ